MQPYTFFKHSGPKGVPSFELGEFATDADARRHALRLLAREARYVAVEVCDGSRDPVRVTRACPPSLNAEPNQDDCANFG